MDAVISPSRVCPIIDKEGFLTIYLPDIERDPRRGTVKGLRRKLKRVA
jgi:hypothetical protein